MAFLTIYTPTHRRPSLLRTCVLSVEMQVCHDYEQVIIHDEIGVGIAGMFAAIPGNLNLIKGDYVYILQDDDVLADNGVIGDVRMFAIKNNMPPVVIGRNIKRGNKYPTYWRERPQEGHIDLGSYVIRRDVFAANARQFGQRYAGDADFIDALWAAGYPFAWLDRLLSREQIPERPGLGRPERELL